MIVCLCYVTANAEISKNGNNKALQHAHNPVEIGKSERKDLFEFKHINGCS